MSKHCKFKFSPSIMGAKPWHVEGYIRQFEAHDIELVHFDVMDGQFVPNITVGSQEYKAIHELTDIPIDLHLMTYRPDIVLEYFDIRPGDWISFHPDAIDYPNHEQACKVNDTQCATPNQCNKVCQTSEEVIDKIHSKGAKAGIAISPHVPVEVIKPLATKLDFIIVMAVRPGFAGQKMLDSHYDKLQEITDLVEQLNKQDDVNIQDVFVDGNVTPKTAPLNAKHGATGFVVGNGFMPWDGKPSDFPAEYQEFLDALD